MSGGYIYSVAIWDQRLPKPKIHHTAIPPLHMPNTKWTVHLEIFTYIFRRIQYLAPFLGVRKTTKHVVSICFVYHLIMVNSQIWLPRSPDIWKSWTRLAVDQLFANNCHTTWALKLRSVANPLLNRLGWTSDDCRGLRNVNYTVIASSWWIESMNTVKRKPATCFNAAGLQWHAVFVEYKWL